MEPNLILIENIKAFWKQHRKLTDDLFVEDKLPVRLGVFDTDNLSHSVGNTKCSVPGCNISLNTLLESENHYNSSHRYSCAQCKKIMPSPHLLDLHVQEKHDSFFAVLATKKPSYCCYIEECKEKFNNPEERLDHCVNIHKLPKDFRFEHKNFKKSKTSKKKKELNENMDLGVVQKTKDKKFEFSNSKNKMFAQYTGRKFTNDQCRNNVDVDMDTMVSELREQLPK